MQMKPLLHKRRYVMRKIPRPKTLRYFSIFDVVQGRGAAAIALCAKDITYKACTLYSSAQKNDSATGGCKISRARERNSDKDATKLRVIIKEIKRLRQPIIITTLISLLQKQQLQTNQMDFPMSKTLIDTIKSFDTNLR